MRTILKPVLLCARDFPVFFLFLEWFDGDGLDALILTRWTVVAHVDQSMQIYMCIKIYRQRCKAITPSKTFAELHKQICGFSLKLA